jgi:peroxiredoxin
MGMRDPGPADRRTGEHMMQIGDRLPEIELRSADGEVVALSGYLQRVTVVQLLRYYG